MVLIKLDNVTWQPQAPAPAILSNVNLEISQGKVITIVGPNGGGKSSLIKLIMGLNKASSGKITRSKDLVLGYVPQKLKLNSLIHLKGIDFLKLHPSYNQAVADALIEQLAIKHLLNKDLQQQSGGELQRLLLCRALLNKPNLLVLDEPTQGVDISGQEIFYSLLEQINQQQNCAILLVSHDLHTVLAKTEEVICLNRHICCHGAPEFISRDPQFIRIFGEDFGKAVAWYKHNHNHKHHLDHSICNNAQCGQFRGEQ